MENRNAQSEYRFVPHQKQREVIRASKLARYITVVTGNQGGKTILGREIIRHKVIKDGNSNNCSIVLSSDFKAIKRNITSHMEAEWGNLIVKHDEVNHVIVLANGHHIYFFSSENVRSIEGATNCIFAWIDEGSDVPDEGYHRVRVRLMTCRGSRLITATAVIGVGVKKLEEEYKKGLNPIYCGADVPFTKRHLSFSWTSADNPYLSADELEELSKDLTPVERQIRLNGKFENIGGRVFGREFLTVESMGYKPEQIKDIRLEHYMFLDTASGQTENERGDDTAIVIMGIAPEYGIYVRECIAGIMSVDQIQKTVLAKCRQYGIHKVGVEHVAAQIHFLLNSFRKAQLITDAIQFVPLKRVGGNNSKPSRHARLLPYVESGRFKCPVDAYGNWLNGTDKLVDQMLDTPYGRHDDCIDAACDVANPDMNIFPGSVNYRPLVIVHTPETLLTQDEFDSLTDFTDSDSNIHSLSVYN